MDANSKKIEFFKNKIRQRLKELCPYMSDVKYRLYNSMINDCQSLDDIREMAELDMQFSMIKYVQELDDKLKKSDTNIDELEAVTSQNNRAAKLAVIAPKKEVAVNQYDDVDLTNIVEDLDDPEIINAQADLLMARMAAEKLSGYTEDEDEDSEDEELYDEMFGDEEEEEDLEDEEEDEDDISEYEDYIEDEEDSTNNEEDSTDTDEDSTDTDEDFIDFGDSPEESDNTEEEAEETEEETDDELIADMFDDEDDIPDEDEDSENDDSEDDLDNINLDDIFGDEEEEDNDFDINEEDLGYTSNSSEDSFDDFFKDCDNRPSKKAVKRELTPNKVFINGTSRGTQTQQMFSLILNAVKGVDKTSQKVYNGIKRKVRRD